PKTEAAKAAAETATEAAAADAGPAAEPKRAAAGADGRRGRGRSRRRRRTGCHALSRRRHDAVALPRVHVVFDANRLVYGRQVGREAEDHAVVAELHDVLAAPISPEHSLHRIVAFLIGHRHDLLAVAGVEELHVSRLLGLDGVLNQVLAPRGKLHLLG